jgi:hypothetical protein
MGGSRMTQDSEKMLAELLLQVADLTSEVMQLRSGISGTPSHSDDWMGAKEAAKALKNEGVVSRHKLQRLRLAGAFSEQREEIRDTSKGKGRPTWEYNVPKCRQALQRYFRKLRSVG